MTLPLIETLCDDFEDSVFDTSLWQQYVTDTETEAGGELTFSRRLWTKDADPAYDFRTSSLVWEVDQHDPAVVGYPGTASDQDAWNIQILMPGSASAASASAGNLLELDLYFCYGNSNVASDLYAAPGYAYTAGPTPVVTNVNKADFKWWRIRDTGSSLMVEYGVDGVTWTTYHDFTGISAPGAFGLYPQWQCGTGTTLRLMRVGLCGFAPPPVVVTRRFARAYIID